MWDNPRLLNLAAGALVGMALIAFSIAGALLLVRSPLFPLTQVDFARAPKRTTKNEIEAALRGNVRGNFFSVSTDEVCASLERLPWVRSVSVRRLWPDRLEVALEERVALARWADGGLIDTFGQRFAGHSDAALPRFSGPPGSEAEVARAYGRFSAALAPLGSPLAELALTARYAWELTLANGLHVMLGRDSEAALGRLERFVAVYRETLGARDGRHEYVDLRYPNGFALRVPGLKG